jgi:hypothetical protein
MSVLAQTSRMIEEKLHQEAIENAVMLEKTPPVFFLKVALVFGAVTVITLLVRKLKKK